MFQWCVFVYSLDFVVLISLFESLKSPLAEGLSKDTDQQTNRSRNMMAMGDLVARQLSSKNRKFQASNAEF